MAIRFVNIILAKMIWNLLKNLLKPEASTENLRQIFISVDITAPAYFMAELDTYKIGVTRNSSSFQHKGTSKRFEIDDFEVDDEIKEVLKIRISIYFIY